MTTYLSPIGYDSTRVTRPILSRGLDAGDEVILLLPETSKNDQRAADALADVRRLLQEIEPDVGLSETHLPYDDLQQSVFICTDLIQSLEQDVVANFGGGARDIYLAFTIAVLNQLSAVTTVIQFSDIDGQVTQVRLPDLTIHVPDTGRLILDFLSMADGSATLPEIAAAIEPSKSTITRHVADLEEKGAVWTEMHGKTKHVELTFTGELHLESRA